MNSIDYAFVVSLIGVICFMCLLGYGAYCVDIERAEFCKENGFDFWKTGYRDREVDMCVSYNGETREVVGEYRLWPEKNDLCSHQRKESSTKNGGCMNENPTMRDRIYMIFLKEPRLDFTYKELSMIFGIDMCSITGRVNELVNGGLVVNVGKRRCPFSNRRAKVWQLSIENTVKNLEEMKDKC